MNKRGRPKGSKNKPGEIKETALEIRRIKREIKDLRAKKLLLPSGNPERIKLGRELKELRRELKEKKVFKVNKIAEITETNSEKEPIIAEILKLDKVMANIEIDLKKHSVEDLQKYLDKLKRKLAR
jgi:ribosomal protein L29